MKESILPRMHTDTQATVLGGIIKHVKDGKIVIVLGEPGEGKSVTKSSKKRDVFCIRTKKRRSPSLLSS